MDRYGVDRNDRNARKRERACDYRVLSPSSQHQITTSVIVSLFLSVCPECAKCRVNERMSERLTDKRTNKRTNDRTNVGTKQRTHKRQHIHAQYAQRAYTWYTRMYAHVHRRAYMHASVNHWERHSRYSYVRVSWHLLWYWRVFRTSSHFYRRICSWVRPRSQTLSETSHGFWGRRIRAFWFPAWGCSDKPFAECERDNARPNPNVSIPKILNEVRTK